MDAQQQLGALSQTIRAKAGGGGLDVGYAVESVGMRVTLPPPAPPPRPTAAAEVYEQQRIVLICDTSNDGSVALGGTLAMRFNGAASADPLPAAVLVDSRLNMTMRTVADASEAAAQVRALLEALPTISSVGVSAEQQLNLSAVPPAATLTIDVRFHEGDFITTPLNKGRRNPGIEPAWL